LIPINDVGIPASDLRTSYPDTFSDSYSIGGDDMHSSTPRQRRETRSSGGTRIEAERGFDRSLLNMINFYRDHLQALLRGETSLKSIPLGNRKRFLASGIVRRFGSRYELTETGSELLHHTRT
jgi:hypothetical protein